MEEFKSSLIVSLMCGLMVVGAIGGPLVIVSSSEASAQEPVTMVVGTLQDPGTLNPFSMTLSMSYTISFLMYDTLNSVEPDLSSGPQLARSWYHSADGRVWYYNITEDALWHDGEELTAHDVAYTFNMILGNQTECALWIDYLQNVTEVVATTDYQVRITTEQPKGTMLSINIPILPKHIWENIPSNKLDTVDYWDTNYFPTGPVGSGPFILDTYVKDDFIRMYKWPYYFIDTANIDELIYKVFTDDTSMMNALYTGTLDVATGVPTNAWNKTLGTEDIDCQAVKALSLFELGMNCMPEDMRVNFPQSSDNLEMNNLTVRRAIAMCINETYIVENILSGLADPGSSLIPTATDQWHYDVPANEDWGWDIARACEILDDAGYRDENGNGIRENVSSGVELDLIFYYRNDVTVADQQAAEQIAVWLGQAKIQAVPQGITESTLYTYWYQARYDLYIWAWDTDVDPSFMLSVMTTAQIPDDPTDWTAWSDCFYANPYYDQLFIDQANTPDFEDRQAIVFEMQQILYRDCPYVVLWYPYGLYAYRTDKFYNFPDMVTFPGMTPGSMWFFFEVMPLGENTAPTNVYAGADRTVLVGTELTFNGSAEDIEDPLGLTYTWTFTEPDSIENVLEGQEVDYTFDNIGTVEVELNVSDPDGLYATDELVVTVEPVPENSGWVNGFVKDGDGSPLSGATVTGGGYSVSTDDDGSYNLTLAEGTYELNASMSAYTTSADVTVVVTVGNVSWQNFTLEPSVGSLAGHIYDESTDLAVEGASVKLVGTTKLVLTNDTGYFIFQGLEPGDYTMNVTKNGYRANQTTSTVVAGEETVLDMNMAPEVVDTDDGGGISGMVLAVVGGVVALVAIAAIALMLKKRKKGEGEPPVEPTPPAP